jgi:transcriptional regulator with XRE-family HTH domain
MGGAKPRGRIMPAWKRTHAKAPEPKDKEVGQLIRAQRLVCRMSQTELANALGVTFQQVQKYEKGVNRVGAGRLAKIADTLGVPISFFFDGVPGPKTAAGHVNEALGLIRTAGALRLVRAFENMQADARGHFLALIEILADRAPARKRGGTQRSRR